MTKLPDTIKVNLRALPRRTQRAVRASLEQCFYDKALEQAPSVALKEAIIDYAVQRYEANKFYLEGARFARRRAGMGAIADRFYDHEIEQALELGMVSEAAAVAEEKGGIEEVARFYAERLDDVRLAADYELKAHVESNELAELYRDGGAKGYNKSVTDSVDRHHAAAIDRAFAAQRQARQYLRKLIVDGPYSPPRVISTDKPKESRRKDFFQVNQGLEHYAKALFNLIPDDNDKLELAFQCQNLQEVLPERELRQLMQLYVARGERRGKFFGEDCDYLAAAGIAKQLGDQELADSLEAKAIAIQSRPEKIECKRDIRYIILDKPGRDPFAGKNSIAF